MERGSRGRGDSAIGDLGEQRERAAFERIGLALFERTEIIARGIDERPPAATAATRRQSEWDGLVVRVEEQQKVIVRDRPAPPIDALERRTSEINPQRSSERLIPFGVVHFRACRVEPGYIFHAFAGDGPA